MLQYEKFCLLEFIEYSHWIIQWILRDYNTQFTLFSIINVSFTSNFHFLFLLLLLRPFAHIFFYKCLQWSRTDHMHASISNWMTCPEKMILWLLYLLWTSAHFSSFYPLAHVLLKFVRKYMYVCVAIRSWLSNEIF